jgi:hypothetical protein
VRKNCETRINSCDVSWWSSRSQKQYKDEKIKFYLETFGWKI